MPFVEWVEDDDARGELAEVYQAYKATRPDQPKMPGILKCFSQRPDFLQRVIQFSNELHFSDGHLDRRTKEMIASLVSALFAFFNRVADAFGLEDPGYAQPPTEEPAG